MEVFLFGGRPKPQSPPVSPIRYRGEARACPPISRRSVLDRRRRAAFRDPEGLPADRAALRAGPDGDGLCQWGGRDRRWGGAARRALATAGRFVADRKPDRGVPV